MNTVPELRGFTLIELMSVLAIVVIVMAAMGFLVGGQRDATSIGLENGAAVVRQLMESADAQSAIAGVPFTLVIDADPHSASYLGRVWIARSDRGSPPRWILADVSAPLPDSVAIVPSQVTAPESDSWAESACSTLRVAGAGEIMGSASAANTFLVLSIPFDPATDSSAATRIVIGAVSRSPDGLRFVSARATRTISLSCYGIPLEADASSDEN
jgi:prepilin-type N-terminal cleavage/methylation domain-containing protein